MSSRPLPTRRQAVIACACHALIVLTCAGLLTAAVLVPAPPVVVPFIAAICIGCPIVATLGLPPCLAVLRSDARLLADMRRFLSALPEVDHPLGR